MKTAPGKSKKTAKPKPVKTTIRLDLKGRTIRSLEREIGVDNSHILRIARGDRRPSLAVAGALARALNITLDDLYQQIGLG